MEPRFKKDNEFVHGIVAALDIVAAHDYGVCFKEIVESAGEKKVLIEIRINGLTRTKAMAKAEFKDAGSDKMDEYCKYTEIKGNHDEIIKVGRDILTHDAEYRPKSHNPAL